MNKIVIADSLKKFKRFVYNDFEVTFVDPSTINQVIGESKFSAFLLTKEFFPNIQLLRQTPGYENTIIITLSDGGYCNVCADINYSEPITEKLFTEIMKQFKMLLSPLPKVVVFNFLKRLMVIKDPDMQSQLHRVPHLTKFILEKLRNSNEFNDTITQEFINDTILFSTFHDIGKLTINNENLHFTGIFDENQKRTMRLHTTLGYELYEGLSQIFPETNSFVAKNIIYYHHEKYDGNGYPTGIKGEDIPLEARIVAVADVYDALRSKRKYKPAFSHEQSFNILKSDKGTHFDPIIISVLEQNEKELEELYDSFL
ncbi:MAG: HD domain-containing phosphohydrolase [Acholeplasma sp.]|nr:HD domain-containing phosphohydrolase [Acholeplasma sp.]